MRIKMGLNKKGDISTDFMGSALFWILMGVVLIIILGILWLFMSNKIDVIKTFI